MAVVINEFEVAPAAASKAQPADRQAQDSSSTSPRLVRDLEKAVQAKQRREHRLTAY